MSNSYLSQDLPHDLDRIGTILGFKSLIIVKSNSHPKKMIQMIEVMVCFQEALAILSPNGCLLILVLNIFEIDDF